MSVCLSVWLRVSLSAQIKYFADIIDLRHVVSVRDARPPVRPSTRSPGRPPARTIHPLARSLTHPTDRRRNLSALIARSQKHYKTIHMWYLSFAHSTDRRFLTDPLINPFTRLLTPPARTDSLGILSALMARPCGIPHPSPSP